MNYKNLTLNEWNNIKKPLNEIIIQASNPDKSDNSAHYDFSIGMQYCYNLLNEKEKINMQIGEHNNLVFCAMSINTDNRRRKNSKINRKKIELILLKNKIKNTKMHYKKYFEQLSNHKFIISPEGNGIDCHRHYEALIAGCIPIIENNDYMKKKYRNLPILYTNNYSEINEEYLIKKYDEFKKKKFDFSNLFLSNHTEISKKMIKEYGNYWCKRCKVKIPYPD